MTITDFSFSLTQLAAYLGYKQKLLAESKGISYNDAIEISKIILYYQETNSLYSRMKVYSPSLIYSLLEQKIIFLAPFISRRLTYVNRDLIPYYYSLANIRDNNLEYKNIKTKEVLDFIYEEKETTRSKIMGKFNFSREQAMDILNELRNNFKIFMHYDSKNWKIYDPSHIIGNKKVSRATATKELVFETIKSFGPITIPQIIKMLDLPRETVATSIISLKEENKIIKGQFIENSSFESYIEAGEKNDIEQFLSNYKKEQKQDIIILHSNDTYSRYWETSDFSTIEHNNRLIVYNAGLPVASFDYQIKDTGLYVKNIYFHKSFIVLESLILKSIKEFAENKGKIPILPKLQEEATKEQAKVFSKTLMERGFFFKSQVGLVTNLRPSIASHSTNDELYSLEQLFPILLDLQFISKRKQFSNRAQVLSGLDSLGVPLPIQSLYSRTDPRNTDIINDLLINNDILMGKFASFPRGIIETKMFNIFKKLKSAPSLGTLEERTYKVIKLKGKATISVLLNTLNISRRVLLATLEKLERSYLICMSKSNNGKIIWKAIEEIKKIKTIPDVKTIKEAWLIILFKILSTNLPLTISQLSQITGLSSTQVEIYIKDLLATGNVHSCRYIRDLKQVQYTTKKVEDIIVATIYEKQASNLKDEQNDHKTIETAYISKNDPIFLLYHSFLTNSFRNYRSKQGYSANNYIEIILADGKPISIVNYRKEDKIEYIQNIETLPEFMDYHSLMLILAEIDEYRKKLANIKKQPLKIKNINNVSLNTPGGRELAAMINNLKLKTIFV